MRTGFAVVVVVLLQAPVATAQPAPVKSVPAEHLIDIGSAGDEPALKAGAYQREGPNPQSKHAFFRSCSFRWFANAWTLEVPVFPGRHNEIVLRLLSGRSFRIRTSAPSEHFILPAQGAPYETRLVLPDRVVSNATHLTLAGSAVPPYLKPADAKDGRELAAAIDWVRVRPLDRLTPEDVTLMNPPTGKEPDLPLPFRLRGTEARPLVTEVEPYVEIARLMRCNVMTIGPMNGQHFTAFPTAQGTSSPQMVPDFIPRQIKALHAVGIAAIGWLPFNVQDLRRADQCQAANQHPEWRMEYIDWPERASTGKVGMCVTSSPWREVHAGILKEAAALGLDGVFFDGFYLAGIPHPSSPGCVCRWCREKFTRDTGLETPRQVNWTSPAFKRWVRWRNRQLVDTAIFFRDRMREANPRLAVTCNYNFWPFGNKDWDTAIPMWSTAEYGVSQHAYTGRADFEWVMLGFKARLSHDLNPAHSDIWRTGSPAWNYDGSPADEQRHELTMRTFMLAALANGTTPWHGGHVQPAAVGIRIHEAVRQRERFFSQDEFRHLGVVVSHNTHDFYGHIPGTTNLDDYRDGILGAWLLLTERHLPFCFVFDNQLEAGDLGDYRALLLPNTACLADAMAGKLREFAARGGLIVATGETGAFDEWGDKRAANALDGVPRLVRLASTPELLWVRERDRAAAASLTNALAQTAPPFTVEAPPSLAVTASWAPGRQALWLHLLNVSAFYTGTDTGFRGIGREPVYAGDVASDAQIVAGGKVRRVNVPTAEVVLRFTGLQPRAVRLGLSGEALPVAADGTVRIPPVDVHDVVVVDPAGGG